MEKRPFQFGLKSIFAAMTFVAVLMAFVVNAPAIADGLDPPLDALFSLMLGAALILGMPVALFAIADGIETVIMRSSRRFAWRRPSPSLLCLRRLGAILLLFLTKSR